MKRFIHILVGLLLLLVLIGQGAGLVHMAYNPECWAACIDTLRDERGWGALAGIVILALVAVYLLTAIRRRPGADDYLSFRNNGATVSILLRAVNEFIAKIGNEFAAIVSMKPTVRPRGASIDVDLELRVKAGTQIPELCQLLETRVRDSVRENLGLSDIKRIRVNVRDIVGDAPSTDEVQDQVQGA